MEQAKGKPGTVRTFGEMPDGRPCRQVILSDGRLSVGVIEWGAVLQDLRLAGHGHALTLGYHRLEDYLADSASFGAICGRVANRIRGARITVDGREHRLAANIPGGHILHGGPEGSGRQLWSLADHGPTHATFQLTLPDGQMGFPGNLDVRAEYRVINGALEIGIAAETDAPTCCNIVPHPYFCLDGAAQGGDARAQILQVEADRYLSVDGDLLPVAPPAPVDGTPFDFRTPRPLGTGPGAPRYDNNLCLADDRRPLTRIASLTGPASGITMAIETTEPGLQVYDGGGIGRAHRAPGLDGAEYGAFAGIALEPQAWPDAPNHEDFPSIWLRPGVVSRSLSRFIFDA